MALDLAQKVGPFPMGVWVAGGAGGILLYEYNKRKNASATATGAAAATTDPNLNTAGAGYSTAGNPNNSADGTGTTTTPTPTALTDNNAWYQKVFQDLIGKGYQPALVDGALQRYLAGQQLSTSDWAIINAALADAPIPQPVGPTSQDPPPVKIPGTPTTTTGLLPPTMASPKKPTGTAAQQAAALHAYLIKVGQLNKSRPKFYVIQKGDTLATIGAKFYANPAVWANLYNANRNVITNPSVLTVGTKIVLPSSPYAT